MFQLSKECKDRNDIPHMLNRMGLVGLGAEIGVWRGDYSYRIMERWNGQKLYLVDPWKKFPQEEYDDQRNTDFDPQDFEFVKERFVEFKDRVEIVRATSRQAAETSLVPNGLDFVYIDANHSYKHVCDDLHMWYYKLKRGGVLAGHDVYSLDCPGLTTALVEFSLAMWRDVFLVCGDYHEKQLVNCHSWYIIKQ